MSELTATQIPKPANEQDFEAANEILWRCLLRDESVQLHGRRGQKQDGVDLFGVRDDAPDRIVGVQAKLKSDGNVLEPEEVEKEVGKALGFKPPLSEYFIVTTAPDDASLNQLALDLSISASAGRELPLLVRVYGWGTLQREIRRHPRALKAFDPSHTPHGDLLLTVMEAMADRTDQADTRLELKIDAMLMLLTGQRTVDTSAVDARQPSTEPEIDGYAKLVRSDPATALGLFRALEERLNATGTATGRERFRVAANIAACQLELGDLDEGIKGLLDAFAFDPENPRAASNKAMAFLLANDWPALKAFAIATLPSMPDNAQLAGYFVQGSIGQGEDEATIDNLVPEGVRQTPEVLISKIRRAMERGAMEEWRNLAISSLEAHPGDDILDELSANALLDRVISADGFRYGRVLSASEQQDIAIAIDRLRRHWNRTKAYRVGDSRKAVSLPLNLITAYRLVHRADDALAVAQEALTWLPNNAEIIERAAAVLLESGDRAGAEQLLSRAALDRETVQMRFNVAMTGGNWPVVIDLVTNHLELFPEHDRGMARASRIAAEVEQAAPVDRLAILDAHRDGFVGDARGGAILSQSARMHGAEELSDHFFGQAVEALGEEASFADRMAVADEAMQRAEPRIVADVLVGHVDAKRDSRELHLLADALAHDYPVRQRAVTFFETLPDEIRSTALMKRLEAVYRINRGEPASAIPLLEESLQLKRLLATLVLLITTYLRLDQPEAIEPLIADPSVEDLPGSKHERMVLAQIQMEFGDKQRGIELGYKVLCEAPDRAAIVQRYFGLILKPKAEGDRLQFDAIVGQGAWVKLVRTDGMSHEGIIGEDADRPWGARLSPANAFIAAALGRGEGETFSIKNALEVVEEWRVQEVKPRWLQAFHMMSQTFGQRFPESRGFYMLNHQDGDITPTLDQVRRTSEAIREHANVYLEQQIPLALVADHRSGGAIGFADYLRSIDKELKVCFGDQDERDLAVAVIEANAGRGAVLDSLTAWRAAELDILDVLARVLGPLSIPSSELNKLKAIVDQDEDEDSADRMRLSFHRGQFIREIITAEDRAENHRFLAERVANIETSLVPEPVVIPDVLPEIGELLLQFPSADAIAPLVLAGSERVLLVEDMAMRQLGQQAFSNRGAWLQVALLVALDRGEITLERYSDAMVLLAAHRHGFLAVSTLVMQSVYDKDETDGLIRLRALLAYLGGEKADPRSHLAIARNFINGLWNGRTGVNLKVQAATGQVMRALLTRHRAEEWGWWAGALWLGLDAGPRGYFRDFLQGHFLPWLPVEQAIRVARGIDVK